jgi:hypothetical protein
MCKIFRKTRLLKGGYTSSMAAWLNSKYFALLYVTQLEIQLSQLISQLKKVNDRAFTEFIRKVLYLIH